MVFECEHIWRLAIVWTKSNSVLIKCVAANYLPYMGCSNLDLENEACLVAFQVLSELAKQKKDLSHISPYFRVVFRSRCIEMTMGVAVAAGCDIEDVRVDDDKGGIKKDLDRKVIDSAFQSLTQRQRQVAEWILNQPTPVNSNLIAHHFDISPRGARRLITNAINRIEHEHRRVCKAVAVIT